MWVQRTKVKDVVTVVPPAIVFGVWVEDKTEHKWIPLSRWFRVVYPLWQNVSHQ